MIKKKKSHFFYYGKEKKNEDQSLSLKMLPIEQKIQNQPICLNISFFNMNNNKLTMAAHL